MPQRGKAPEKASQTKARRPSEPRQGADALAKLKDNLQRIIDARDSSMKKFSLEAGLGETFVRDALKRNQDPGISKLATLAKRHGLSLDMLVGIDNAQTSAPNPQEPIKVVGEVGAGKWHEIDDLGQLLDFEQEDSPFPPDPNYPIGAQFDLVVRGTSINRFARDGMRLRCVDIARAGIDVMDNDLVIMRRSRDAGHMIETTAKRIRRLGATIELWPDSDDPKWQTPQRIDLRKEDEHEEGAIVALVLYAYSPARPSRRR